MPALRTFFRILAFRASRSEIHDAWTLILAIGLISTWLVGIGRWWDDPRDIPFLARMGLGSVLYIFALSGVLWLTARPFVQPKCSYFIVLAFVATTSLPGAVYAVPVERWTDMATAGTYNVVALVFVSTYRVSLLFWFFRKILGMNWLETVVSALLPICVIAFGLTMLGHGASIMDIMGGFRDRMSKTEMESIVGTIGCLSVVMGPVLAIVYAGLVAGKRASRN